MDIKTQRIYNRLNDSLKTFTQKRADEAKTYAIVELDTDGSILMYGKNNIEWFLPDVSLQKVLGKNYFYDVAPCTNNFLFEGRFKKLLAGAKYYNFDYVFTYKLSPTKINVTLLKTTNERYFVLIKKI